MKRDILFFLCYYQCFFHSIIYLLFQYLQVIECHTCNGYRWKVDNPVTSRAQHPPVAVVPTVDRIGKEHGQNRCLCIDGKAKCTVIKFFQWLIGFVECTLGEDGDITFTLQHPPHEPQALGTAVRTAAVNQYRKLFIHKAEDGYACHFFLCQRAEVLWYGSIYQYCINVRYMISYIHKPCIRRLRAAFRYRHTYTKQPTVCPIMHYVPYYAPRPSFVNRAYYKKNGEC